MHVGPLRAKFIEHFAPLVRDVVIAGDGRERARRARLSRLARHRAPSLRGADCFRWPSTGSSNRIARLLVLDEPPSLDAGEMTDKGSINQRAVLARRAALVDELYCGSPRVLVA